MRGDSKRKEIRRNGEDKRTKAQEDRSAELSRQLYYVGPAGFSEDPSHVRAGRFASRFACGLGAGDDAAGMGAGGASLKGTKGVVVCLLSVSMSSCFFLFCASNSLSEHPGFRECAPERPPIDELVAADSPTRAALRRPTFACRMRLVPMADPSRRDHAQGNGTGIDGAGCWPLLAQRRRTCYRYAQVSDRAGVGNSYGYAVSVKASCAENN